MYNRKPAHHHKKLTAKEIMEIGKTDPLLEIAMFIPEDITVVHIRDKNEYQVVLDIIKDRKEKVMVTQVGSGIDIYVRAKGLKNTDMNVTALGIHADFITSHKHNYIILPYKNPKLSKSRTLKNAKVLYYNGIDKMPKWLTPMYRKSKPSYSSAISIPLEDRYRDKALFKHFHKLNLIKFTEDEKEHILDLLDKYIVETGVDSTLAKKLVTKTEERVPESEFFDEKSGKFHHHKLGELLIEECHVKKDKKSGELYHYNEIKHVYEHNEEYLKGVMTRTVPMLKDHQKTEVIKYMDAYLEMDKVTFNKDPFIIVFKNGVLDLGDMKLMPHSPDHLETIALNVNYNPDAKSKTADEFFKTATLGETDLETLLFEAIGYSFLKTVELAKTFILTGSGRNGKSTYLELINELVGDENATAIDPKSLSNNFRISKLYNRLVSVAGDISSSQMNDTDMLKSLASGDKVLVEKKYSQAFEEKLFATMFFSANKLPRSPDTTYGFYRRFCPIPFRANLDSVEEVDGIKFKRKLLGEESKEYVAYKAVHAIANVFNTTKKFTEPKSVKAMLNDYRIHNSTSLLWAYNHIKQGEVFDGVKVQQLYAKYKLWCEQDGYKHQGRSRFVEEIASEFHLKTIIDKDKNEVFKKKALTS